MNRIARKSCFWMVLFMVVAAGVLFAQSNRSIIERKVWYTTDTNKKVGEARFWTIFLGNYDMKITRDFPGEGRITFDASINYQLLSSGYIEGNGAGSRGKLNGLLPAMLIKTEAGEATIQIADIDYIYDWGTKVALRDGRKGDFMMSAEGKPTEIKRFSLREFKEVDSFGEKILNSASEGDKPIVTLAFTKEASARAAKEPVSE